MELYIGGFAQGKLEYVTNKYNCAKVYDGKNYKNLIQNVENKMITEKIVILDHFNDIIRNLLILILFAFFLFHLNKFILPPSLIIKTL